MAERQQFQRADSHDGIDGASAFQSWFGASCVVDGPILSDEIVRVREALRVLTFAEQIRVFGSAVKAGAKPKDLDVFIDLRGRDERAEQFSSLLRIARANYGLLDPFLRTDNGLLVRNDSATGWTKAKNARALEAEMDLEAGPLPIQGRPLVVYHGTTRDFSTFDDAKLGASTGSPWSGLGHFFTPDPKLASNFTKGKNWNKDRAKPKLGANVMPVYLALKNPMRVPASHILPMSNSTEKIAALRREAEKSGFDGIIIEPFRDSFGFADTTDELVHAQYIAFRPEQIKSAIGNNGEFDVNSSDITGSASRDPEHEGAAAESFDDFDRALAATQRKRSRKP